MYACNILDSLACFPLLAFEYLCPVQGLASFMLKGQMGTILDCGL